MSINKSLEAALTAAPVDVTARLVTSQTGCTDISADVSLGRLYEQKKAMKQERDALLADLGLPKATVKVLRTFKPANQEQAAKAQRLCVLMRNMHILTLTVAEGTGVNFAGKRMAGMVGHAERLRGGKLR